MTKYQISGIGNKGDYKGDYSFSWHIVRIEIDEANKGHGGNGNKMWDKSFDRETGIISFTTKLNIDYERLKFVLSERGLVLEVLR